MFVRITFLGVALLVSTSPDTAHAAESYDNCKGYIDSLPAVVSTQGTWCLRKNLSTAIASGAAITVSTNNVTIDCNNFKLGGLAAGAGTQTRGIFATDRSNVTVRNCAIRGFIYGIQVDGLGAGHLVEENRLDNNTNYGILLAGDGSVVQRNIINDTGGIDPYQGQAILAISVSGSVDVLDNTISGVAPVDTYGFVGGIAAIFNSGGSISRNRIRGLLGDPAFEYSAVGISASDSTAVIRDNDIVGNGHGVGVTCENANVRVRDNVVSQFVTGVRNCGDAGGNDVYP